MSTKRAPFPSPPSWFLGLVGAIFATLLIGGVRPAQAAKCPNLVIILDKSGSMTSSPSGGSAPPGGSKWDLAKAAIKSLLKTYDGQLPIGMALFASDSGCGAARLDVPPDYDTATKISTLIDSRQPDSSTPTSEAINSISKEAVLHDPSRSQYILLLTDGEPNCASGEQFLLYDMDRFDLENATSPVADARLKFTLDGIAPGVSIVRAFADTDRPVFACGDDFLSDEEVAIEVD